MWEDFYSDMSKQQRPHSLIRVFVVQMKKLCSLGYQKCAQWRFYWSCGSTSFNLITFAYVSWESILKLCRSHYTWRLHDDEITEESLSFFFFFFFFGKLSHRINTHIPGSSLLWTCHNNAITNALRCTQENKQKILTICQSQNSSVCLNLNITVNNGFNIDLNRYMVHLPS